MCRFLFCFLFLFSAFAIAEERDSSGNIDEEELEKEELEIQTNFPQYRVAFSHKAVQEEVYEELLKELKEKEKSD